MRVVSANNGTTFSSYLPTAFSNDYMIEPLFFDFSAIKNLISLAKFIGIEPAFLKEIIETPDENNFYIKHLIPKRKDGEFRVVWEIKSPELMTAHKSFQRKFEVFAGKAVDYPNEETQGYINGRSTFTNASVHAGAKYILHADIQNFFQTIGISRLETLFRDMNINEDISAILSRFLTIKECLPLGLPASPLIANLVCRNLDKYLKLLAGEKNCLYTRYADDLTFSSSTSLPEKIEIQSLIEAEGFKLSDDKFHITKRGQSHFVTGLSVSEEKPYIPRKLKRRIRQELFYAEKFGLKNHLTKIKANNFQSEVNRIAGTIGYINGIEPELAENFQTRWKNILEKSGIEVVYQSRLEKKPSSLSLFIDESEIESAAGKVLAIGCVVIENVKTVNDKTVEIYNEVMDDPFATGDKRILAKKGLHFVDVSEDARTKYIEALHLLPFRAFIIYDLLPDDSEYERKYFELIRGIIPSRLSAADRADVNIIIEQNSKITFPDIKTFIEDTYSTMETHHQRRPQKPPVIIEGEKLGEPCISVVDFILAVFGQYAPLNIPEYDNEVKKRTQPGELKIKRFERLREKIRLIISRPTKEFFVQKNSFLPWKNGNPLERKT